MRTLAFLKAPEAQAMFATEAHCQQFLEMIHDRILDAENAVEGEMKLKFAKVFRPFSLESPEE